MTAAPMRRRTPLPGISSRAWEHPADRGALVALRKLKGFDTVLKAVVGLVNERAVRLAYLGSAVRVDERQFPDLHYALLDVASVLDATGEGSALGDTLPELFVVADPTLNAYTIGIKKPFIVLTSGLVALLDSDERRFVVAHELGHALSGHALYQTLLMRLISLSGVLNAVPVGGLAIRAIVAALNEWSRKSELSADRAALLATQDPAVALRVHMQTASGGHLADLDPTSFQAQGQEYLGAGGLRDSVLKMLLVENASHPFAVVRAAELRRWMESGEYARFVGGGYPRRIDDPEATMTDAAKDAAASYTEAFGNATDTIGNLVHDVAGYVGTAKVWLDEQLRRRRGGS